ncbi:metal dependent phosphohydrolase [Clostridium aceticum]|uniref:Metal dependent phosphohydrolase n=1 Tax=Clostridium aceticum TaxID=84022 RepID=A0A0D8I6J4_9CLOT|nr:HDIG domain-containing metalloprotein [Clostridium aceticum]AKL95789.1 metal dependent phosphohydrolase [Clostridium aceticum]KJF25667.1 phosphohydrolase [Clostridium aceticum]
MKFLKDWRDKLSKNLIGRYLKTKRLQHILLAMIFFVSIFSLLTLSLRPEKFDLSLGHKAPADIYSPKDIEDRWTTQKLKEQASESVELIYYFDNGVHIEVKKDIESFFQLVYGVRENEELDQEEKQSIIEEQNHLNLNKENLQTALTAPLDRLNYLETYIYEIIAQNMNTGIKVENLQLEKGNIKDYIIGLEDFNEALKELAITVIHASIRPNMFFDIEATERLRREAVESVERIMIKKGDLILREGDLVTYDRLELLRELAILTDDSRIDVMLYLGIAFIVLVLEILIIAYIYVFNREILQKTDKLLMALMIILGTLLIAKGVAGISIYIIPVAVAAMLVAILLEARLALLVNICLTILVSIIIGNDMIFVAMAILGGTAGVFSVINTQQRANIFLSGMIVSIVNIATIIGIGFINSNEVTKVLTYGFYGVLNGLFCSILTVGTLPLWESLFEVVTPLKLVELFNPNQPLLKKLLIEAPGTYHHSIIVGNLSEAAADAVGGNALLARVGAFYHDIGKIKRPYFFKENQLTSENPHDKLTPSLSSLIITGHVKDGVDLAKKYKLPSEVRDFIEQHHGDTLVAYFYHKAKNGENGENIDEQSFRYGGPKPQTKEVAIVMLADSVEAAVRSMSSPSKEKIENLTHKIIQDKLEDGQLEESNLTLKEVDIIKKTFVKVMLGIFHERIEYPDTDIKELKGRKTYGAGN